MTALRWLTAGESHGPGLSAILEGMPAGLAIDFELLARDLKRRQHGYGRGRRMQIEADAVIVQSGVRDGSTLGSPIGLWIENRDYANWRDVMAPEGIDRRKAELRRVHRPRPGHTDLAGGIKYLRTDLRDVLERASARETTARVALGALARMFLRELGIEIRSGVLSLGTIGVDNPTPDWEALGRVDDGSPLRAIHPEQEAEMVALVDRAKADGDTLGGATTVIAHGVPAGWGSHVHWDRKLDGRIGQAMLSIHAVKAVELGSGVDASRSPGSLAHDAIHFDEGGWRRPTNRAGGVEGGITNGADVVVTLYKKPIATTRQGLPSVDLDTLTASESQYERSDVTALPAAGVIGEAMLALVLAQAALEKLGGDSMAEVLTHHQATRSLEADWPRRA